MQLTTSFRYATSVWLTAVVVPPVLLLIGFSVASFVAGDVNKASFSLLLILAAAMLGISLLLSIPSWLILIWAIQLVNKLDWSEWNKRILLFGIGSILTILPFIYLSRDEPSEIISSAGGYWLLISFGIFLYRFPHIQEGDKALNQDFD